MRQNEQNIIEQQTISIPRFEFFIGPLFYLSSTIHRHRQQTLLQNLQKSTSFMAEKDL